MGDNQAKQETETAGESAEGSINEKYLAKDIIGPYSGIVYGRQGEKVKVLNDSQVMVLVEQGGARYYVRMENLVKFDESVPLENILPEEKETVKPVQHKQYSRSSVKKAIPPIPPNNNQSKLF
jgi:hypothetical protein